MKEEDLKLALHLLAQGAVVGLPTDTVYGIGADANSEAAVDRLFALKSRPFDKPIGLLVANAETALKIVNLPDYAVAWISQHWPGPLNLVGRAIHPLPNGVGDLEHGTVGVRVPNHPATLALLHAFGPLAVTSANRSSGAETLDERMAKKIFGALVSFYLPGECPGAVASTTVDVTGPIPRLLRKGPLDLGI